MEPDAFEEQPGQGGTMTYEYKVFHRADGTVELERFYKEGLRHREGDRPAVIRYRSDGSVALESFYKEGQRHREVDRPAVVSYRSDGTVEWESFWKEGLRHREVDRPAAVRYRADGSVVSESFYKEGQMYTPSKAKPCEGKTVEIDGVKYVLTPVD